MRVKWGKIGKKIILLGEHCAVKYADEIIVLSRSVQKYFKDKYGRRTVYIPNAVERAEKRVPKIINKKWGLNEDNYILFLGRIVPEKGVEYLIRAFMGIDRTVVDKKLVIAGGSSDTDSFMVQMKKLAQQDDRIIFTGFVDGRPKEELYSNAYLYVLPSDVEGMPLSLLEALSYGNCCLVSDIDECAEVIEDKGLVFKHSDIEDLKKKLIYLIQNPDSVYEYKNDAAEFVYGKYNWSDIVKKVEKLYMG